MKPRLMFWTCRLCYGEWKTVISENPKPGEKDEHMTSICEECGERMARIQSRNPVKRTKGECET